MVPVPVAHGVAFQNAQPHSPIVAFAHIMNYYRCWATTSQKLKLCVACGEGLPPAADDVDPLALADIDVDGVIARFGELDSEPDVSNPSEGSRALAAVLCPAAGASSVSSGVKCPEATVAVATTPAAPLQPVPPLGNVPGPEQGVIAAAAAPSGARAVASSSAVVLAPLEPEHPGASDSDVWTGPCKDGLFLLNGVRKGRLAPTYKGFVSCYWHRGGCEKHCRVGDIPTRETIIKWLKLGQSYPKSDSDSRLQGKAKAIRHVKQLEELILEQKAARTAS